MRFSEHRGSRTVIECTNELNALAKVTGLTDTVDPMTVSRWDKGENIPRILWQPIIEQWSSGQVTIADLQAAHLEYKLSQN